MNTIINTIKIATIDHFISFAVAKPGPNGDIYNAFLKSERFSADVNIPIILLNSLVISF